MIALFTDFGSKGPYTGQVEAVIHRMAPEAVVIDLLCDAPAFNPRAAAYLLAALVADFPHTPSSPPPVFLCVVDPGVGTRSRLPIIVSVDGRWFVGPNNGIFGIVSLHGRQTQVWPIDWRPKHLSPSFHGRDLFAPVAAGIARGEYPRGDTLPANTICGTNWPADLAEVVYIDHFGNAMVGYRAISLAGNVGIRLKDKTFSYARTFAEMPKGQGFWYKNALGLVEVAVNQGDAARQFGLSVGTPIHFSRMPHTGG